MMGRSGTYSILVLIGLLVFLVTPIISRFELRPDHIYNNIGSNSLASELENRLHDVLGQRVGGLKLQSTINEAVEETNNAVLHYYSITEQAKEQLLSLMMTNKLDQAQVDQLFSGDSLAFQRQAFSDYGSWLYGRDFANQAAAEDNLNQVIENIEKFEITPKFGVDRYEKKNIQFNLAASSVSGLPISMPWLFMFLSYGLMTLGGLGLAFNQLKKPAGINNNGVFTNPATSRKWLGIIIGSILIAFYIVLYFLPHYMVAWIVMVNPLSFALSGNPAGQFFLYGFLYTLAVLVMGVRMLVKYRFSRYQVYRTLSVMFFQLCFAFLLPEILVRLNQPYFDFKNIWPLDYDFFFDFELNKLIAGGNLGLFMLVWGIALTLLAVPILTYFYGKRWYCSWVCGCGGLAETAGDPFRHLSDKSVKAWNIEQGMIYSVLVFAILMTGGVLYTYFTDNSTLLGLNTYQVREVYGVFIGAGFAGVIGTGFYPLMGNRVWCRFGCPLAAYLGIIQRFKSRFRITTNGGQCISCGNCSTYCEMGIDVRSYAQRGENIVRASCVGCGICATVCPRGVLKLENNSTDRFEPNGFIK